jgi:hypothetical protein
MIIVLKDLEGRGHDLIEALSQHLPGKTKENYEKPVRIAKSRGLLLGHLVLSDGSRPHLPTVLNPF